MQDTAMDGKSTASQCRNWYDITKMAKATSDAQTRVTQRLFIQFQALADPLKPGRPQHCKEYPISVKADNPQPVPMTFTLSGRTTRPLWLIHASEKDVGSGNQQNQVGGKKRETDESLTRLGGPFAAPI